MEHSLINGALLKEMVVAAASLLEKNKQQLNDLNVFPVPDGDTGTNMSLTMQSVLKEVLSAQEDDLATVAKAMSRGALKGARGNSGVILSQILRGFAKQFETCEEATAKDFILALKLGQETAYKAVMKPKEGTILTIIRVMAEKTKYETSLDLCGIFDFAINVGEETLLQTPEMLPQLKKAGVVDAGGQGLMTIMHAFSAVVHGEEIPDDIAPFEFTAISDNISRDTSEEVAEMDEITFAYCTEFFIQQLKPEVTEKTVEKLRNKLAQIGDSLVVVGDPELVKVHVHTNDPGKALQMALELGELYKIKIENMVQQHREIVEANKQNLKEVGIIAIASGDGFTQLFKDLGADYVVTGGQTMNPSTEDISAAVKKVNAKSVIILPNNSNIILAAEQAQDFTDKKLFVIPTKTVPQGIATMLAFDPDENGEDNAEGMMDAYGEVLTGSVTYAVRDTEFDGQTIHEGNILGLQEGTIAFCGEDLKQVTIDLAEKLLQDKNEILTIYYGKDTTEDDANDIADVLSEKYPDTDFEVVNGGQPVYYYLISAE
ncbi:MAG: DAK2 domain-containing protein [Clostridiales bacterium]|nr:DAK2 domain-containing protein [Clostridiales bacterium]